MSATDNGDERHPQPAPSPETEPSSDAASHSEETSAASKRAMPVHFYADFMRSHAGPGGTETVTVSRVDAPELAEFDLRDGTPVVCEEPGEFQLSGVLRRHTWAYEGVEYWEADLDPHSLIYHIRIAPQTLYNAGPEGCARFSSWMPGRLPEPEPEAGAEEAPTPTGGAMINFYAPLARAEYAAKHPANSANEASEVSEVSALPKPPGRMRVPTPWRLLTLGAEGTWEQWNGMLAYATVEGESAYADGARVVLVDDKRAVDAIIQVQRLPPEEEFPAGRRVWLAEPDWETIRPSWPETAKRS